ncbi:uncharacterized protein LOC107415217 [Ziziphus jujuba]|uniref:Uncharacterized protein LOC107415217 n=1 Tax=Ziziphus jujuba TaxID=326968 RepID=A0A6P3ZU56_ZIZJJ|nr:uncharacterized protein LOC107415217 [Ziziphus jujuba]
MSRESHNPIAIHSSIALLQERFRQLQRMKEMREGKELIRMLVVEPNKQKQSDINLNPTLYFEPPKSFPNPDFLTPQIRPISQQDSLSLWQNLRSNMNIEDFRGIEISCCVPPTLMNLWPVNDTPSSSNASSSSSSNIYKFEDSDSDSDVDTSLHL